MKNKEFLQEYGDQGVEFHSYYKFVFTYRSGELVVFAGGDSDNIYRCNLKPKMTVKELDDEACILSASHGGLELSDWSWGDDEG